MTNCNYSEHAKIQRKEIQKQIEELQAKLEELENQKPPIEEAFKRVFGVYPYPCTAWEWFQKGYNAAEEDVRVEEPEQGTWNYDPDAKFRKQEEVKKLQEKEWTYKITDEKGESNPYKQYLNGVKTLRQELFDYGFTDSQIEDIILIVNRLLPEPIKETCGMKDWGSAWTIGYNNYRDTLMGKLK